MRGSMRRLRRVFVPVAVAGALSVERSEDLGHARTLLAEGVDVSRDEAKAVLGDADADLAELTSS